MVLDISGGIAARRRWWLSWGDKKETLSAIRADSEIPASRLPHQAERLVKVKTA
jgi:hypothetical protein